MLLRERGVAPAIMAGIMVVVVVISGTAVLYTSTQKNTTTVTSVRTSTTTAPPVTSTQTTTATATTTQAMTTTVTAPPVTSTETTTAPPVTLTSTTASTATATDTTTATVTSRTTVTSTKTSTVTATTQTTSTSSSETSSATTSSTSTSCTTSTATNSTENAAIGLEFVQLAQTFSRASITLGENTTSGLVVGSYAYGLDYASPTGSLTTYKMTFILTVDGFGLSATGWVLSNGTILATEVGSQNSTGLSAVDNLTVYGSAFIVLVAYNSSTTGLVPTADIHATGQMNVTLGMVTMTVTDYQADSLPLVYSDCSGDTYTLGTFALQAGTVPGTNFTLLTYLDMQGTEESSGLSQPLSLVLQVTSITLA
jgi:hypothetical protein